MKLALVVAAAENGVIGKGNKLPWRLPADLKMFKQLTLGHTVIMGSKTYDSIGKPLPGRTNIVLSKSRHEIPGCLVFDSIEAALNHCKQAEKVFIIGGGSVYADAFRLDIIDEIYLTKVHHHVDGDTHFHIPNPEKWGMVSVERHESDDDHLYPFSFVKLERKR